MPATAPGARPGTDVPLPSRRTRLRQWWRRRVLAHRRLLAFCCVVAAVLSGLQALAPTAPGTDRVQVAARDLASGTVLGPADLTWSEHAPGTTPDGLLTDPVGRTLAAPMRRGEALTDARVLAPALMPGYPGRVAVPVRVSDPVVVDLLRVGDVVDLVSADPRSGTAETVARDAPVVALPPEPPRGSGQVVAGRVLVVALDPDEVAAVTVSGTSQFLTPVWSG